MIENLDQNQIIFIVTVLAASAVVTGFMAGFFGIGGGLIMVPILFYIFSFAGIEQSFIMHLAIGTSFSIIIPTSIISAVIVGFMAGFFGIGGGLIMVPILFYLFNLLA